MFAQLCSPSYLREGKLFYYYYYYYYYSYHFLTYFFQHFEEAFKVYEKGLEIFRWPALTSVWVNYLKSFENRYQAKKLERLRDMYERVLLHCPDDKSKLKPLITPPLP